MAKVLIVDDEARIRSAFAEFLEDCGHIVLTAENGEIAKSVLRTESPTDPATREDAISIVLCDLVMPECGGDELFEWMRANNFGHIPFVCISGHSEMQDVMSIIQKGAMDFIAKPISDLNELQHIVERAVSFSSHPQGLISLIPQASLPQQASPVANLVGRSPKLLKVAQMIARVAHLNTTVLITGESGTGKEVVARAIHTQSPRKHHPFVAVNCAAIPTNLIESELFGYEKGAFTGAVQSKAGKFAQAHRGTIFLDEIGELDISLQSKLLRVIQERAIEPVGSTRSINIDVRIIAATNRDLEKMVSEGKFRSDLLFRLRVYPIILPPLRDRKEDILPLIRHLASKICTRMNIELPALTKEAFQKLLAHSWPGNIRELENTIERALIERAHRGVVLPEHIHILNWADEPASSSTLSQSHTPAPHRSAPVAPVPAPSSAPHLPPPPSEWEERPQEHATVEISAEHFSVSIPRHQLSWNALESSILKQILTMADGNISQAAKLLDLPRSHLRSRLRFHGLGK
jgi:two-component system response regulator AtoC